jgi:hypothetical protein
MFASALPVVASLVLFMGSTPEDSREWVGPIFWGEFVKMVQLALGPGWKGRDCQEPVFKRSGCNDVLVYTDGADQLKLYVDTLTDGNEVVGLIESRQGRAQGGAFRYNVAPLRQWRWAGGTLFSKPRSVDGWKTTWSKKEANYRPAHAFAVWITNNAWGGLDFHMFSE